MFRQVGRTGPSQEMLDLFCPPQFSLTSVTIIVASPPGNKVLISQVVRSGNKTKSNKKIGIRASKKGRVQSQKMDRQKIAPQNIMGKNRPVDPREICSESL